MEELAADLWLLELEGRTPTVHALTHGKPLRDPAAFKAAIQRLD